MKKKLLSISLIVVLISSCFIGCGKKEQTAEAEITESAEISEEASQETPSPTPEIADSEEEVEHARSSKETDDNSNNGSEGIKEISDTPTKSATGEFTIDQAMEKLLAYLNARPALFEEFNGEDINAYHCAAEFVGGARNIDYTKLITKDGFQLEHSTTDIEIMTNAWIIESSAACEWYYNWVNNGEYMSTSEYIMSHTYDEIAGKYNEDIESLKKVIQNDGDPNYSDTMMLSAIYLAKYMDVNKDSIVTGDVETAETAENGLIKDTVSNVEVVYQLPVFVGSDKAELYMLFDKDGNMLNLVGESEEYIKELHVSTTDDIIAK